MRQGVFMGKRQRRRFTEAFKQEAVRLCLRHDRSIGQVARELDLTESALRRWVQQYEVDHGPNPSGALTTEEKTELRTLRREVRVLREEREILKKAAAGSTGQCNSGRSVSAGVAYPSVLRGRELRRCAMVLRSPRRRRRNYARSGVRCGCCARSARS